MMDQGLVTDILMDMVGCDGGSSSGGGGGGFLGLLLILKNYWITPGTLAFGQE